MEANVRSQTNGSNFRHLVIASGLLSQKSPQFCAFSTNKTGFPCQHLVAVVGENHGYPNMQK